MSTCRWAFPWPNGITTNHMYRPTERRGQRALTTAALNWRARIVDEVLISKAELPAGDVALDVALYPPDRVKRDVDGPIKLLQDAIFRAFADDDYRVVDLHVRRYPPDRTNPRIVARLSAFSLKETA